MMGAQSPPFCQAWPTGTPKHRAHPWPGTVQHLAPKASLLPQGQGAVLAVSPAPQPHRGGPGPGFGYGIARPAVLCAHLLDAVADFGGVPGVAVVGKHGVDDAVQGLVLGTQGWWWQSRGRGWARTLPALPWAVLALQGSGTARGTHRDEGLPLGTAWSPPSPPWGSLGAGAAPRPCSCWMGLGLSPTPRLHLDSVSPGLTGASGTP